MQRSSSQALCAAPCAVLVQVALFIANFLRAEGVEKKRRAELDAVLEGEAGAEEEREMWKNEELVLRKVRATRSGLGRCCMWLS